jgi:hypothetical protein
VNDEKNRIQNHIKARIPEDPRHIQQQNSYVKQGYRSKIKVMNFCLVFLIIIATGLMAGLLDQKNETINNE